MEQRSHSTPAAGSYDSAAPPPPPPPAAARKKDRHMVSWTPQEDDQLRDQVAAHGIDNWTSIAARFKDKTGRQCRRRWYTYLNAECKKGGWSAEEDMLLCEAQKVFGNRWTEIAKVVSGRTDNAVKNRFTTLCKKRTKLEDYTKENSGSLSYQKNKRILTHNGRIMNGIPEVSIPTMHDSYDKSNVSENHITNETSLRSQVKQNEQSRPPLAVLVQNFQNSGGLPTPVSLRNTTKAEIHSVLSSKCRGAFFNKDDPKVTALLRQADLLSSLAAKVNTDGTSHSLENAWKEFQDYLVHTGETGSVSNGLSGMDFILDDFKGLIEDLKSSNIECQLPPREQDLHEESQGSSEYSTGTAHGLMSQESTNSQLAEISGINENVFCPSTSIAHITHSSENVPLDEEYLLNHTTEITSLHENVMCPSSISEAKILPSTYEDQDLNGNFCILPNTSLHENVMCPSSISEAKILPSTYEDQDLNGNFCILPNTEFSSPTHTLPIFTEGIPSPQFSASERQVLLSMFGLSSPVVSSPNSIKEPCCKKALLDSL